MTRKDFQRIDGVLAYAETHCDDEKESATVEWVAGLFADDLAHDSPGFRRGTFEATALPIKHREAR